MARKVWASVLISIVMVIAAACGNNAGSGSTNGGTNAGGESTAPTESTAPSESASSDAGSKENYKIAISQYVEHPSLDATREGFIEALKDAGLVEGENLTIDYNNAQADSTNNLSIAQKLAGDNNDLILAIATPPAIAVAQQLISSGSKQPLLFAAVTDPVDAKLVEALDKPGEYITGASDTNPEAITKLMDFIAANFPDVKKVGVVINEGEPNAVVMTQTAEEALAAHNIELVKAPVTNTSEVKQAVDSLVGKVDALYITLDNTVVSAVDTLIQAANDNDIPFFSADRDTVEKGAFATVGFKYYDHGYQVGEMAVEILKNGKKPSELPVTLPNKLDFILNLKAAEAQGITVTDAMKQAVQDQENNIIQ